METVRPFVVDVPDATINKILDRVRFYEWPEEPEGGGWAYGTSLGYMKALAAYWVDDYDWRAEEAKLNRLSHFLAEVGDLTLHFVWEKGSGPDPMPLILSHGWPSSFFEFTHVVEPLAHPERFGGSTGDAFDVVVPSLPGYAFSGKPKKPLGPRTIAGYFDALMTKVLGYDRYVAQGGDWGSAVSAWLGFEHAAACRGVHLNMVGTRGADSVPETEEEKRWDAERRRRFKQEGAYFLVQSTKPQSLSYAMADSPVGVAAWIVEKFAAWSDLPQTPSGEPDLKFRYTKDQLLTNIMVYLVTRSVGTASWLYRGLFDDGPVEFPAGGRVEVPVGVSAFPGDGVFKTPLRSLVEKAYNVRGWSEMPRGGHFAALEEPGLLIEDVRTFVRSLR
jgi:pimeloyl-ACP methyl ester carboxylesterase